MEAEKNSGKESKRPQRPSFYRFIKALSPVPYLIKARDYYIRSMTECAGRANYSGMVSGAGAPGAVMNLPKSFSTSSSRNEDEFSELVRAASQRRAVARSKSTAEGGVVMLKSQPAQAPPFPRSFSTSTAPMVGRIDEESPCYFPGSFKKVVTEDDVRFPRSRSCNTSENPQAQAKVAGRK